MNILGFERENDKEKGKGKYVAAFQSDSIPYSAREGRGFGGLMGLQSEKHNNETATGYPAAEAADGAVRRPATSLATLVANNLSQKIHKNDPLT